MSSGIVFLPEAEEDLAQAFNWHESQSLGLGDEFLRNVEACLALEHHRQPLGQVEVARRKKLPHERSHRQRDA